MPPGNVQVLVNDFPGEEASYRVYTKLVKGLVYDRASNEIRYGDTVCAKVRDHQFLINRWHSIDETGSCAFDERQKEVAVDNGLDNPYSYSVTESYLTVSTPLVNIDTPQRLKVDTSSVGVAAF